jgi:hypothetical protein
MSKLVKLDDIKPGMVLDKDVANLQGAVLLRKGSEITERHLGIFKTWGVNSIFIKEALTSEELGGRTPNDVAQNEILIAEKKIADKFAPYPTDATMQGIKLQAIKFKTSQIKAKYNV